MQINDTAKKAFNITFKVLAWVLIAFTVFMMIFTVVSVMTVDKNDRDVFGYKFYIVQTDSMSLSENNKDLDVHFNAGDIVVVKNVEDCNTLKPGDIITFLSTNKDESYLKTITHMIRSVERTDEGALIGFVTYGTNTGTDDSEIVTPTYVLGQYTGKLPGVGNFFAYLKTTPGYIVCILLPFLLLIVYNGFNVIRLYLKYKGEQNAIIEAEKAEVLAERKKTEDMLNELKALQAQLMKKEAEEANDDPDESTSEEE